MFKKLIEWNAAKMIPRFKDFRDAKKLYETFIRSQYVPFHLRTDEQRLTAEKSAALSRAAELFQNAIRLAREDEALQDVAIGLYQLGMLFHLQGYCQQAVDAFEQAIEILENLPQSERHLLEALSDCYYHIGVMKLIQNNREEGQKRLQKAYEMNCVNDDSQGQDMVCHAMNHFGLSNLLQ